MCWPVVQCGVAVPCLDAPQLAEGATLFLGAALFLASSAGHLLRSAPQLAAVFAAVALIDVAQAGVMGLWLRRLNLAVRQAMGRMFGFTLSIFAHMPLVSALGLEGRAVADYRAFASDYFAATLRLNCLLAGHTAATSALSSCLRLSVLALGGAALFDGATSVGSLIALLQYCSWLQKGLKQASDSWVRLMAGLGSVERLVELHDRGTFGAQPGGGGADGSGGGGSGDLEPASRHTSRSLFREDGSSAAATPSAAAASATGGGGGQQRRAQQASARPARASAAAAATPAGVDPSGASLTEPLLGPRAAQHASERGPDLEAAAAAGSPVGTTGSSVAATAGGRDEDQAGRGGGGRGPRWWAGGGPPRPARPDFGRLRGGFKLSGVHLTTRGRTDRLLLRDANLEVQAGQAVVISGDDPEGLHGLLSLLMLRMPPYKGNLAFQLPTSALPSAAALLGPSPLERLLRRDRGADGARGPDGDGSGSGDGGGAETFAGGATETAAAATAPVPRPPPLPPLPGSGGAGGAADWEWAAFSFRHDDLRPPRSKVALISRSMCGLFRTTLEDNVALAAPDHRVGTADVRRACQAAGLHDEAMSLKDGYFTLLGEGSCSALTGAGLLRLAVARALLRRAPLVLLEDADAFAEALGEARLMALLRQLRGAGCCVVVVCGPNVQPRWDWADAHMHLHGGTLDPAPRPRTLAGGR
ncbi:hypothetical protein GPECTOR_1g376 [Gonium pectorale]|uniref:ABC transporter domain-containing protein n=1 Tax=Gonium pectorale TaxID=33097 RepID=A0A150H352_GONPE|nr:hypothetical protein GPECTOR_1g376 [Gonium pectorale]|eukprot:KXZ56422.1 hypothetical protein GPECTOR_1g376 [Gonium pectorale]